MPSDDHRGDSAFPRGIGDPNPVPIGQHDVRQHEVIGAGFEQQPRFFKGRNEMNPIAGRDEDVFQDRPALNQLALVNVPSGASIPDKRTGSARGQ